MNINMKNPGLVHLLVALVWLFLSGNTTTGSFLVALIGSYGLMALFKKAIGCEGYIRRVNAFFVFLVALAWEIILSDLRVMKIALSPRANQVAGGFMDYDISGLTDFEVLLISFCIGLSPGTMVADKIPEEHILVIHIFPSDHPETVRKTVDRTLKRNITAFTR